MQGAQQETTAHSLGQLDTPSALWLLGSLAGFYRRPFDAALVLQRFAPPFDFPSLIEALEASDVTDIVSVGIGGSDLGPRLMVDALALPGAHNARNSSSAARTFGCDGWPSRSM